MKNFLDEIKLKLTKKSPLYIRVKIITKSAQTEIVDQMEDETYKIRVAAMPVKGAANEVLCKFLKKSLSAKEVVIVTGGREAVKLIRLSL